MNRKIRRTGVVFAVSAIIVASVLAVLALRMDRETPAYARPTARETQKRALAVNHEARATPKRALAVNRAARPLRAGVGRHTNGVLQPARQRAEHWLEAYPPSPELEDAITELGSIQRALSTRFRSSTATADMRAERARDRAAFREQMRFVLEVMTPAERAAFHQQRLNVLELARAMTARNG